jgi:hypothetical protein
MRFNLNLQASPHRTESGDRKFAPAKSSVNDSAEQGRDFRYLAKKSRQQNYLATLTRKRGELASLSLSLSLSLSFARSSIVNNQARRLFAELNLLHKSHGSFIVSFIY